MESLRQKEDRIGPVVWTRKEKTSAQKKKKTKKEWPAKERVVSRGKKVNKVKRGVAIQVM